MVGYSINKMDAIKKIEQIEEFRKKYKYPIPRKCPLCGGDLKDNTDIAFRCRKCQTEFIIWISYEPKDDRSYWFDFEKQKLKPDYIDKFEKEQDIKKLKKDISPPKAKAMGIRNGRTI